MRLPVGGLRLFFGAVLLAMLAVTAAASWERAIWEAGAALWPDPWFRATLADAYFGFLTIWLWMAYRESGWGRRLLWLLLVVGLGNIAIAGYVLWRLSRLAPGASVAELLLRPAHRPGSGAGPRLGPAA